MHEIIDGKWIKGTIKGLPDNGIFVFGSNEAGVHGKGAALDALHKFGAKWGQGYGLQGRSFGIPTKDRNISVLTFDRINYHVDNAVRFFGQNEHLEFYVTRVGCGLAGYQDNDISSLFINAKHMNNVFLPIEWRKNL